MAYKRRTERDMEIKTTMTIRSSQIQSHFPLVPSNDYIIPDPNPMDLYPVIQSLGKYLPWESLRDLQFVNTTWADALRPHFLEKSKLRIDMSTVLKQQTVSAAEGRDGDEVTYAFLAQDTELKVKSVMRDLQEVYPVPNKKDSVNEDIGFTPQPVKHIEITITKLDSDEIAEELIPWLQFYGRTLRSLKLLKSPIPDDIDVLEGAKPLYIVPKLFETLLQGLQHLETLELHGISRESTEEHLVYENSSHAEDALEMRRKGRENEEPSVEIVSEELKPMDSVKNLTIHHCSSEFCKLNMTVDLIKMFRNLERLSLRFFEYGHPLQVMRSLSHYQPLENITHLELVSNTNDYPEMIRMDSLEQLCQMRFRKLKSFSLDPISVEDDHDIEGANLLLIFLQNTSATLERVKLRWTSSHIFWDNGREFLEHVFQSMPLMIKLKSFDATMDCAYSTVPLLIVLRSFPNLQNFSLTPSFFPRPGGGKNTPVTVDFLPKAADLVDADGWVNDAVTSLALNGVGFRIAESFMQRLSHSFPHVRSLTLALWSGRGVKGLDLQIEYLYGLECLRNLTLVCKGMSQAAFDTCMNSLLGLSTNGQGYSQLERLKIVNADYSSLFRKIEINSNCIQYYVQESPFIESVEFDGFDGMTHEDMKFLEEVFKRKKRRVEITVTTQGFPIFVDGAKVPIYASRED